jgi:hypothetical protein
MNCREEVYSVNEEVLALCESEIYKAKIIKVQNRYQQKHYFIHYLTWKKNWDHWVSESQIAKYSDQTKINYLLQSGQEYMKIGSKQLISEAEFLNQKQKDHLLSGDDETATEVNWQKTKKQIEKSPEKTKEIRRLQRQREGLNKMDLLDEPPIAATIISKFCLTQELKVILYHDWKFITEKQFPKLILLPQKSNCTVNSIMKAFLRANRHVSLYNLKTVYNRSFLNDSLNSMNSILFYLKD